MAEPGWAVAEAAAPAAAMAEVPGAGVLADSQHVVGPGGAPTVPLFAAPSGHGVAEAEEAPDASCAFRPQRAAYVPLCAAYVHLDEGEGADEDEGHDEGEEVRLSDIASGRGSTDDEEGEDVEELVHIADEDIRARLTEHEDGAGGRAPEKRVHLKGVCWCVDKPSTTPPRGFLPGTAWPSQGRELLVGCRASFLAQRGRAKASNPCTWATVWPRLRRRRAALPGQCGRSGALMLT